LTTQRRIASAIVAYDDLIENNEQRIKILEEMARSLYREWFVNFRFPGHEKTKFVGSSLGKIPDGWSAVKFGDVADISWGDTATTKSAYVDKGYLAYSATGPDGFMDHFDFERDGVVLSAIGAKCGRTWLARGKWSCIKNTIRFWGTDSRTTTEYLFLATCDPDFWPKRGAAQPFISQGDAKNKNILVPSSNVLSKFNECVREWLALGDVLHIANDNLRATRDLLLPRLICGEIDVSSLPLEPAAS
jgi:type I restriction enzyme S subunit